MDYRFNLTEGLIAIWDCEQDIETATSAWRRAFDLGPGL